MKEQSQQLSSTQLNSLFAQLNPLDVEQFYTAYQLWSTRQRIQTLQAQIDDIQRDIVENAERLEQIRPSALALATLARLQSNGVSDVVVLDRMLERGEEWLDRTMQRLDYCEKLDVISEDYTKWCEHALEGAYDWIDSMLGQEAVDASSIQHVSSEAPVTEYHESIQQEETHENGEPASEKMEELLLQKLMSDDLENAEDAGEMEDAENDTSLLETTLKIGVITQPTTQETSPYAENAQSVQSTLNAQPAEQDTQPEAVESTPVLAETRAEHTESSGMAIEQQEEQQQPAQQSIEDKHEAREQPETARDTQEPMTINEPHVEISTEQEAAVPASEAEQIQKPDHLQEVAPTIYALATTSGNQVVSSPATSAEVKQNRGFLRSVIAVLFHV